MAFKFDATSSIFNNSSGPAFVVPGILQHIWCSILGCLLLIESFLRVGGLPFRETGAYRFEVLADLLLGLR